MQQFFEFGTVFLVGCLAGVWAMSLGLRVAERKVRRERLAARTKITAEESTHE